MLSRNSKNPCIARCHANERRHEYATSSMLLAFDRGPDAIGCCARAASISTGCPRVLTYVDNELPTSCRHSETRSPRELSARAATAAIHVNPRARGGHRANVLVAMFAERESHRSIFCKNRT